MREAEALALVRGLLTEALGRPGANTSDLVGRIGDLRATMRAAIAAIDTALPKEQQTEPRCPAAHPDDPTSCDGPPVVTVLDAANAGADGCEHHGARLLASLDGGRVYPLPDAPGAAAIRVFNAAYTTRPFAGVVGPLAKPSQRSHAENHRGGEHA